MAPLASRRHSAALHASSSSSSSSERLWRLVLVTDAWLPQTNGVVTTWRAVIAELLRMGIDTQVIHPGLFETVPCPLYPEVRFACNPWKVADMMNEASPDAVHIATEGPLGIFARHAMMCSGRSFTTSMHTNFAEYGRHLGFSSHITYQYIRWFHSAADQTLCATPSHKRDMEARGLHNLVAWGRGVDTMSFHDVPPQQRRLATGNTAGSHRLPVLTYVGRVSTEKNVEAFLSLRIAGEKVVVGDGPMRAEWEARYPGVKWLGHKQGPQLTACYQRANVLVFPSRTDTFGLVMLEANACGTPVAAFPVTGPIDVVKPGVNGYLDEDLGTAIQHALTVDRDCCRRYAEEHNWMSIAIRLVESLTLTSNREDRGLWRLQAWLSHVVTLLALACLHFLPLVLNLRWKSLPEKQVPPKHSIKLHCQVSFQSRGEHKTVPLWGQ